MKTLYTILASMLFACTIQATAFAQTASVTETFKKHFNQTVEEVHDSDRPDEQRAILNESFNKMITAIDRIESRASLTEDESAKLASYKSGLNEKLSELNGVDGFDEIMDEDLEDFSGFSQDFVEQANSTTITIGVTTALLILIILLLL